MLKSIHYEPASYATVLVLCHSCPSGGLKRRDIRQNEFSCYCTRNIHTCGVHKNVKDFEVMINSIG
jgi:hypothetical protein